MGWSTGSAIMADVMGALQKSKAAPKVRRELYKALIPSFLDYDCDTLYECRGEDTEFDRVLNKYEPPDEDE